jgi:hypothetical protein
LLFQGSISLFAYIFKLGPLMSYQLVMSCHEYQGFARSGSEAGSLTATKELLNASQLLMKRKSDHRDQDILIMQDHPTRMPPCSLHVFSEFISMSILRILYGPSPSLSTDLSRLQLLIHQFLTKTDEMSLPRDLVILAILYIRRVSVVRKQTFRRGSEGAMFISGFILAFKMTSDVSIMVMVIGFNVKTSIWAGVTGVDPTMLATIERGFLATVAFGLLCF